MRLEFLRKYGKWLACFLLFAALSPACSEKTEESPLSVMNGIRFSQYEGFQDKWKLVTVRYREDTGEQRFVYANDKALSALNAAVTDYPDGAVFAKIGIVTEPDPSFISSKIPSGVGRYQFMVRDRARYASTGGWGYALFQSNGHMMTNASPAQDAFACYACHQIVRQKGFVFSEPFEKVLDWKSLKLERREKALEGIRAAKKDAHTISFSVRTVSEIPKWISQLFPHGARQVAFMEGPLRTQVFDGTLNEIQPLLLRQTAETGKPALFLAEDGKRFALIATREKNVLACPKGQRPYFFAHTSMTEEGDNPQPAHNITRDQGGMVIQRVFCGHEGKPTR